MKSKHAQSGATARSVNDPTAKGKGPPELAPVEKKPVPVSRTEAVQDALRQAIIEQKLHAGTRLPEDAIGDSFGTSRTIAREALGRLAVEGLVELKPNKGAFVANPSLQEGHDTFLVRRSLEQTVTSLLAGKLKPADIEKLNAFVDHEQKTSGVDRKESIRLAGEFHLLLEKTARNRVLELAREPSNMLIYPTTHVAVQGTEHGARRLVEAHRMLVQALRTRDKEMARLWTRRHLNDWRKGFERTGNDLDQPVDLVTALVAVS